MKPKPLLLYVEDEHLIAMAIMDELNEAGFEVDHCGDGKSAIAKLDVRAETYVAMITDVRLPEVDGWALARHSRELNPQLPVVYVSGDSASEWASEGVPKSLMLQKPFDHAQLITAVTTLINERSLSPHFGYER